MSQIEHLTEEQAREKAASRRRAVARHNAGNARAERSLFPKTDAEHRLREQAHTEYSNSLGERQAFNVHDRDRHADTVVASMAPVLREANLTGQEAVELRKAMTQAPLSPEASAARLDSFVDLQRTPIHGTKPTVTAEALATKQALHQSPALRKALNTGNGANSLPLARSLSRRLAEGDTVVRGAAKSTVKTILG